MSKVWQRLGAIALGVLACGVVQAADPVAGRTVYLNTNGSPISCGSVACHGPDPSTNQNSIRRGQNDGAAILQAISSNKGGMGFLGPYVSMTDADNIGAFIANPTAGVGAPVVSLSTTSLSFGNQALTTTSGAMTATLTNTGSATLNINNLTVGGTHASDFTRGGTCTIGGTLAVNASCTITATFSPTAMGARSGSITIAHNAAGGGSSIALAGTGTAAPGPAVGLSGGALTFASQTVGTTSAAQTITVTNTGSANLNIVSVTRTGAAPNDYATAGTCTAGASVAPSGSCTIAVTFTPQAVGASNAGISLATNAAGSPNTITLSGTGQPAPTPVVSLSTTSLLFGNQTVGMASATQTVTLTNTGAATLNIASIAANDPSFSRTTTCGSTLAASASCTVTVTFTPGSAAVYAASLVFTTNAASSPNAVALSGTGIAGGTTLPTVGLSPATLTFAAQSVNVASAAQTVTLTNTGTVTLNITGLTLTGAQSGDFARSGTCTTSTMLAPAGTCTLVLTFTPTAVGARAATLNVISNASGSPSVALAGTGAAPPAPIVQLTPPSATYGTVTVGGSSMATAFTLTNAGNAPLSIASIRATGDFAVSNGCGMTLAASASCVVNVFFAPTATGARAGTLTVTSNAASSPNTVALSGTGQAAGATGTGTGGTATTASVGGGASAGSNAGSGGCAIGTGGATDPLLPLLAMLALVGLARRRMR